MRRSRLRYGLTGVGIVLTLAATVGLASRLAGWFAPAPVSTAGWAKAAVRRADLSVVLTAGGRVESAKQTVIECELENLEVRVKGQGMRASGASTILSLIPDGTMVQRGDVLCRLDASDYEELVRQQKMSVERARADHQQAGLDLDVARMAVREFREGTLEQTRKDFDGRLAQAQTDWQRATDRRAWARRMLAKGYVPVSLVLNEDLAQRRAAFSISQTRTARAIFERFGIPKTIQTLQSEVLAAEAILNYQTRRLQRHEDRLAHLERQVERCTIRAPHEGFVIYAHDEQRGLRIEEGIAVRQRQRLFYLPDLGRMEVVTLVHESVASRVGPGMRARVRVDGVPNDVLEGHVVSVAQLPTRNFFNDLRYFVATVALDTLPRGLRPGMSAEVAIATARRRAVLAIPPEALVVEQGRDVCYVTRADVLERREVRVGGSTRDLIEVSAGLHEGEQVVLDPAPSDTPTPTLIEPEPAPSGPQDAPAAE